MRNSEIYALAAQAHANQVDKLGEPYINHCVRVAISALDNSVMRDSVVFQVGLLHDVLEDALTIHELKSRGVDPWVVYLVGQLTRDPSEHYMDYITRLEKAEEPARIVKVADLEDNLNPSRIERLAKKDSVTAARLIKKYQSAYNILKRTL